MTDATTSERGDIFAALVQEHAQIEAQLAALVTAVGTLTKSESDAAALGVITGTLEFFAKAGARHEEVEELLLFPRFRSRPEFKQILSALEMQHRMNRGAGDDLRACVDGFTPGRGRELQRLAFRFVDMHRGHAFAEERALFPLAASTLSQKELAELSREFDVRKRTVGSAPKSQR